MKTGLIIGKFLPFHLGHAHLIEEALSFVDRLVVIVSYNKHFNATLPIEIQFLTSPRYRNEAIHEYLLNESDINEVNLRVKILSIDESNIPQYPNGWQEFTNLCNEKLQKINCAPDYIFTGETNDIENYQKYFPNSELHLCDPDRNIIQISTTEIREKIKKFREIYSFFENYLPFESTESILDDINIL